MVPPSRGFLINFPYFFLPSLSVFSLYFDFLCVKVCCCWQLLPFSPTPTAFWAAKQLLKNAKGVQSHCEVCECVICPCQEKLLFITRVTQSMTNTLNDVSSVFGPSVLLSVKPTKTWGFHLSISLNVDALNYCVKAACSVKRSEWSISLEKCYKMPLQSLFLLLLRGRLLLLSARHI